MIYKWLNKKGSNKVIIFFNGWGMDDLIVSHLDCEDYDVVVVYNYNESELSLSLDNYEEKHLIAWSMGVMTATNYYFGKLNSAIAICGTPYPINDKYGIPERIYNLTIKGFSEKSMTKFMERMFIEKPIISKYSNRDLESQKNELIKLLEYSHGNEFKYTKAIVGDSDLIIPTKNQINFWKDPLIIHSGHCPFMLYNRWTEILEL